MQQYNVHKQNVNKMKYVDGLIFQEVNHVCPHTDQFHKYIIWTDQGDDYDYIEDETLIKLLDRIDYVLNEINY